MRAARPHIGVSALPPRSCTARSDDRLSSRRLGRGLVNSVELRMPPPTLPYVGNSVSFVLFHDMGNVFRYPGDMFTSIKNFRQPDQQTCYVFRPRTRRRMSFPIKRARATSTTTSMR